MSDEILGGVVLYVSELDRLTPFYAEVLELRIEVREADHIVLTRTALQVVLLKQAESASAMVSMADTPWPQRASAAIKPVFVVRSLAVARAAATRTGGVVNAARHEWRFHGYRVCDAVDPDGNLIQLRERLVEPVKD